MRRATATLLLLAAALGCKEIVTGPTAGDDTPRALRLDATAVQLDVGATRQVTAQLLDGAGRPTAVPPGLALVYGSSAPAVFTVTQDGLVTGVSEGQGVLRAAVGALQVGATVTVAPAGPRLVKVSGDAQAATPGGTLPQPLRVRALDGTGTPVPNVTVTFTPAQGSAAPTSAATDGAGEAATSWTLGGTAGAQSLVASATGYRSVTFAATAAAQPITSITVTPSPVAFTAVGQTQQLAAVARDAANNVVPVAAFTWSTSNAAVATVSPTGLVTAVGNGTANISAAVGAVSGAAQVTVTLPAPQARLGLDPDSIRVVSYVGAPVTRAAVAVRELNGVGLPALGTVSCGAVSYVEGGTWATVERCTDSVVVRFDPAVPFNGVGRATIRVTASAVTDTVPLRLTLVAFNPALSLTPSSFTVASQAGGTPFRVAAAVAVSVPPGTTYAGTLGALQCTITTPAGAPPATVSKCGPDSVAVTVTPTSATGQYQYFVEAAAPAASPAVDATGFFLTATFAAAPPPPAGFRAALIYGTCANDLNGDLYCWGSNSSGQLGDGTTVRKSRPTRVAVPAGGQFFNVDLSGGVACASGYGAIAAGVYCWGSNSTGATGVGTFTGNTLLPTRVNLAGNLFQHNSVGGQAACATTDDGFSAFLYCWGGNSSGLLGNGTVGGFQNTPVRAGVEEQFVGDVAVGYSHACAISGGSAPYRLYCWGRGWLLGNGNTSSSFIQSTPILTNSFPDETPPNGLVAGDDGTCLRNAQQTALYCWGSNSNGEMGVGTFNVVSVPTQVLFPGQPANAPVTAYTMGENHACAIVAGATYCWGSNNFGQLGTGDATVGNSYPTPQRVLNDPGFSSISAGQFTTCGIVASDSSVRCWGYGLTGELGNGQENNSAVPVQVIAP